MKKSILYLLLFLGLPLLLRSQQSMPFELLDDQIVFQVNLNQVPLKFALDFKHNSILDQEVVERLQLAIINTSWYELWEGDSIFSNEVLVENFSMADWAFRDRVFTAIDFDSLEENTEISGFIGIDFFKNFVLEINFPEKMIFLRPLDYLPSISAFRVNLAFHHHIPYASVSLNQQTVSMILDFSATQPLTLSKKYNLSDIEQLTSDSTCINEGDILNKHLIVHDFQLGDLHLKDVCAEVPHREAAYLCDPLLIGGMGTALFKDRIIYMDYNKKSLWINL